MRVPKQLRDSHTEDAVVRQVEDDDSGSAIMVDFGPDAADMSIDVIDETVIVVTTDRQFEFDLPAGANDVSVNNGVLTISE